MFDNLNLRNRFLAVAAIPVNVLVVVVLWALIGGQWLLAGVALAGGGLTMAAARHLAGPVVARVEGLTTAAAELASVRLPALLDGLDQPRPLGPPAAGAAADETRKLAPAPAGDELGRLAAALADVENRARAMVDQERAAISRQLGAMVRNLARRSQSLLDRQIDHIDWLEAQEQDPDRLEQLFKLDHLATRMRRTSESVLVLGGAESTRQRGGPAPVADVLRVAMGETEDYRNIRLRTVHDVAIAGGPAFDLAHLLAEVLENATQFSPPETPVELHATALDDGSLCVTVIDRGVGMDAQQLEAANALVADPPEISLALGHSVGFVVIGRLARRLAAAVELSATAGSGVTVQIHVPASLVLPTLERDATPVTRPASEDLRPSDPEPASTATAGAAAAPAPADPLHRLRGLRPAELPEREWTAPPVNPVRARPLRHRDGAGDAADPTQQPPLRSPARSGTPAGRTPAAPADPPPGRPERTGRARTLAEAIPSGTAFDSGVDGLLAGSDPAPASPAAHPAGPAGDDGQANEASQAGEKRQTGEAAAVPWTPPGVEPGSGDGSEGAGLTRRQRGATSIPSSNGPRARASARKPEEIRSMLTRYRDGLKSSSGDPGGPAVRPGGPGPGPGSAGTAPTGTDDQETTARGPQPPADPGVAPARSNPSRRRNRPSAGPDPEES